MSTAVDMPRFVRAKEMEALPPPNLARGPIAWVRENLFSGTLNTILTLVVLYLLYIIVPPLIKFLFIDAVWTGTDRDACRADTGGSEVGACWAFIWDKLNYFIYGSYTISRALAGQHLLRSARPRRGLAALAEGAAARSRRGVLLLALPDPLLRPADRRQRGSRRPASGSASPIFAALC